MNLAADLPDVDARQGCAEAIPADDHGFDAVLVAQAWHWVDPLRAVPEIARVLRPHGRLGLVWNVRDERHDWVAQLGRLMHCGDEQETRVEDTTVGAPFGPLERHDTHWEHPSTPQSILDLVASRSYVITLPEASRRTLLAEVSDLLGSHPDLGDRSSISVPYLTYSFRTQIR